MEAASSVISSGSRLPRDSDEDKDSPGGGRYDEDDNAVLNFGKAADTSQALAITRLVRRYYAAASASDGAEACALIYSPVAESAVEDYGASPDQTSPHAKSCETVVSGLFKRHPELAAKARSIEVTYVRVEGDRGLAVLRFGRRTVRRVLVHHEHGAWKMGVLLDMGVP